MSIVVAISLLIVVVFFSIQVVSLVAIDRKDNKPGAEFEELPKVSLLLAARNEELLIVRSLEAIEALNYPKDRLEVLVGNDNSTDRTSELVRSFIAGKSNFRLIDIHENLGKGRGKANVLAHLAHEATGEYFFITDVDVKLPKNWIHALLAQFHEDIGIVSGTTTCKPTPELFARLQSVDWLHFMGYIQSFANLDVACTSVGNNMAVRSSAYWETGGYENIDFSITEDYKLFKEVTTNGWGWRTIFTPDSLGLAWHIPTVKEMLHQRKRWLIGARELPWNWKFLLVLYGLFLPALVVLAVNQPALALALWLLKFIVQTIYIRKLCALVDLKKFGFTLLFVYEFYVLLNTLLTAFFYYAPVTSVWKGRRYKTDDLT
jgi:cellulose synthase/poly-beta-1,6-N-acetylglucosamine synthase-like glycosyltransferase